MKKNQKGFSVVEVVLIVVLVGIIGGLGWYVWQSRSNKAQNNNSDNKITTTVKNEESLQTQKQDPYQGWKTYSSIEGGFSLKYPTKLNIEGYSKKYGEPGFDSDPVGIAKFTGKEYWINFYSKSKNEMKDNFVIDIRIDPASENIPANTHGDGKVIKTLANGFEIWQVNSDSCLTTNLVTSKSNQGFVKLPNGNILKYLGTFCYGQGMSATNSVKDQLNTAEYKTALDILSSVEFN